MTGFYPEWPHERGCPCWDCRQSRREADEDDAGQPDDDKGRPVTATRTRLDIIYAANLKPGDLYAGQVNPDAPTMPVQPCAVAPTITEATPYQDGQGHRMMRLPAGQLAMTSLPAGRQVLVIRI